MPATMTTNGRNVKIANRIRIAAQNMLEGDEFLLRGEPSLFIESISRNESRGTVRVRFENGEIRTFDWDQKVSIKEKSDHRASFRRNTLRRAGYPNYYAYSA
jgi:siroheme synthase (precorrin-2 oxidase/ferrochelatase)